MDLSKHQEFDNGQKAMKQINFSENLGDANNTIMLFIIEEAKETFSKKIFQKELWKYCVCRHTT